MTDARPGESPENAQAVRVAAEAGISIPYLPSLGTIMRDQLVVLRPAGPEIEITNDKGTDKALPCRILVIDGAGPARDIPQYQDLGVREVFWQTVRAAVQQNTSSERPWYGGRLRKMGSGRGYMELRPPVPDDIYRIVNAVVAFTDQEKKDGQLGV